MTTDTPIRSTPFKRAIVKVGAVFGFAATAISIGSAVLQSKQLLKATGDAGIDVNPNAKLVLGTVVAGGVGLISAVSLYTNKAKWDTAKDAGSFAKKVEAERAATASNKARGIS